MFLACGVGAYAAGIFHLMTHAFFKGLLFLAAGSVIHAMGGEQDMRKMGGLRKKIPVTYWTMLIATLAIAGIPGFAGFFSKDEILEAAQVRPARESVALAAGRRRRGLTSFYMFRLVFLTFFGKPRYDEHKVHVHESPKNMTVPLMILAFFSIFGGWFAAPQLVGGMDHFENFLQPVFAAYAPPLRRDAQPLPREAAAQRLRWNCCTRLTGWPVIVGVLGLLVAWWFYIKNPEAPKTLAQSLHGLYTLLAEQILRGRNLRRADRPPAALDFDERALARGGRRRDRRHGERRGAPWRANRAARLRKLQSGNARSYATWVVIGAVGFTVLLLGLWGWCTSVERNLYLLTVITFLPLLSVAALLLLRSDDHVWIRRIALAASLAEFAISLLLLRGFDSANAGYQFQEFHDWIGARDSLSPRRRRHQPVPGPADHVPHAARDSVLLGIHPRKREGLLHFACW